MDKGAQPPLYDELRAAFDWWREAGVDCEFGDEPTQWLAPTTIPEEIEPERAVARVAEKRPAPAPPPEIVIDHKCLPQDLGSFAEWWLTASELDAGRTSGRIAPRGSREAELMVLVTEPEREDRDALLSGPQGKFLGNMLRAMGYDAGQVYFASALPRHLPGADWKEFAAIGIGEVLRHHIALVSPRRLVTFGGNILPLIGNDLSQGPAVLRKINLEGQSIDLLAARDLAALLERPRWKAELWRAWLGWTGQAQAG